MKEKILQRIKGKLGQTSLSDRTISQKAERLLRKFPKEEDITDEVIDDAVEDLRDLNGQYSHDVAEKVKELEIKNADRKDDAPEKKGASKGVEDGPPEWLKDFKEEYKADLAKLTDRMEKDRSAGALNAYKATLKKSMIDKGANREYFVDIILSRIQKAEESSALSGVLEKALSDYDAEIKSALGDGASPRSGSGSGGGGESALANAFFKKKEEEIKRKQEK